MIRIKAVDLFHTKKGKDMETITAKYIDDYSAKYGSSDKYVIASKDGITVTFDLDLSVYHDVVPRIESSIEYNGAVVTESEVSITPNEDWVNEFTKEVISEMKESEQYKATEENYLLSWIEDDY